jgi:hypothetical protein
MNWDQEFKNYSVQIGRKFIEDPENVKKSLAFKSNSGSLYQTYLSLIKNGELTPIEQLDDDRKRDLWEQAKEVSSDVQQCIVISKCIYLLEEITKA